MNYNQRLFILFESLKESGRIKNYVQLADILGTNKAGINDLKTEKKKLTIDNINSMILSYPDINLYWFISGAGDMFVDNNETKTKSNELNKELIEKICELTRKNTILESEIDKLKKCKPKQHESVQHSISVAAEPKLIK